MPLQACRSARLFVALVVAGTLVACGAGVPPKTWAKSVCSALQPWRTEITNLNSRAQQEMSSATTPEQTKQNLLALVSGAQSVTETALSKVVAAGTPDVSDGKRIATRFADSVRAVRDAYAHAKGTINGLDTGNAGAFYSAVAAAIGTLNDEYAKSNPDTGQLGSADLKRVFAEVPECR